MDRFFKLAQKSARMGAIALAVGVSAPSASAFTVTGTTSDFTFGWTAPAPGSPYTLTGTGSVDITAFSATSITMTVVLTNTTNSGPNNADSDVRLTAWGFGIDPSATSVTFSDASDGGMVGAEISAIPSQKEIDVCAFGGVNCPGGSNGGIFGDGGTDTFSLTVFGNFSGGTVEIAPLGYKFQTNFGSYEFSSTGSPSSTGTPSSTGVPEPGSTSLALLGLALLGAGFRARNKKKAQ